MGDLLFVGPGQTGITKISRASKRVFPNVFCTREELKTRFNVSDSAFIHIFYAGYELCGSENLFTLGKRNCYTYTIENTEIETVTFRDKSGTGDDVEVELPRQISVYDACGVISDYLGTDCDNIILFDGDRVLPWWSECCFNMDLRYLVQSREEVSIHVDRCPGFSIKNKRLGREGRSFTVSNCSTVDDLKSLLRPKHPQSVVIMELVDSRHYVVLAGNRRLCRYHNGILYCAFVSHKVIVHQEKNKQEISFCSTKNPMTYKIVSKAIPKRFHKLVLKYRGYQVPNSLNLLHIALKNTRKKAELEMSYLRYILFQMPANETYEHFVTEASVLGDAKDKLQFMFGKRFEVFLDENDNPCEMSSYLARYQGNIIRAVYSQNFRFIRVQVKFERENRKSESYEIEITDEEKISDLIDKFSVIADIEPEDIHINSEYDPGRLMVDTPFWKLHIDENYRSIISLSCKYKVTVLFKNKEKLETVVSGLQELKAKKELQGLRVFNNHEELIDVIRNRVLYGVDMNDAVDVNVDYGGTGAIETFTVPVTTRISELKTEGAIIKVDGAKINENMYVFSRLFEHPSTVFTLEREEDISMFFKFGRDFIYKFSISPLESTEELISLAVRTFKLHHCKFAFEGTYIEPSNNPLFKRGLKNGSMIEVLCMSQKVKPQLCVTVRTDNMRPFSSHIDLDPHDTVDSVITKLRHAKIKCSGLHLKEKKLPSTALIVDLNIGLGDRLWTNVASENIQHIEYKHIDELGRGEYGAVSRVKSRRDGKIYAKKEIYQNAIMGETKFFTREVEAMQHFNHPCIIRIHDWQNAGKDGEPAFIVMEYAEGGTLKDALLDNEEPLSATEKMIIIAGVAFGMNVIHMEGFIHRDLKPANILLDKNKHSKIADLGCTRILDESLELTFGMGTPMYMSPEQSGSLDEDEVSYNQKTDVYSFGMILYEVITGKMPSEGLGMKICNRLAWISRTMKGDRPKFQEPVFAIAKDLIEKCWHADPGIRPEFSEIIMILKECRGHLIPDVDEKQFMKYMDSMSRKM